MRRYVLEAQRYTGSKPQFVHVGYVDFLFSSQEQASYFFYDQYPWDRAINRDGNWTSDWNCEDGLRYMVVEHIDQNLELRGDTSCPTANAALDRMDREVIIKHYYPHDYLPPLRVLKRPSP